MNVIEKLITRADAVNSLLCIGLDTAFSQLPVHFQNLESPQFQFNQSIIEQTHSFTASYKLNTAFYEARGAVGWRELEQTIAYIRQNHSDILTICDAKRGDIGSTNDSYAAAIFDEMGFDAVTLHPYTGREALSPFLSRKDKGAIILCRTSNPGAGELQDLQVNGQPLWQVIAEKVSREWNTNSNCMLVVGATYPDEMRRIRAVDPDIPFLVPGVGAQGGDVDQVVQAGLNRAGKGIIINASRSIIFADQPGTEAKRLQEQINQSRRKLAW